MAKQNPILEYEIDGMIDENCPLFELELDNISELHLYLSKVNYINSTGVKAWLEWITPLRTDLVIILNACQPLIVNQINTVKGFVSEQTKVNSFFLPYYDEGNDVDFSVLVRRGEHFSYDDNGKLELNLPPVPKASDGTDMELDVLLDKYIAFLKDS